MNPKYQRQENEDSYEYGLRLIELKVEQNPSDLEWSDIVDLLDLNVHYDSLRKAANVTPYSGYNVMKYFKSKAASGSSTGDGSHLFLWIMLMVATAMVCGYFALKTRKSKQ